MKNRIIIVAGGATGAAQAIRNVLEEKGMDIKVVESEVERKNPFDTTPTMLITNPYLGMDEIVDSQLLHIDKHASKKQIKNLSRYHSRKK
jgi:hypothetical protein